MAISGSGLFVSTIVDVFDTTQLAVALDSETALKIALYPSSITPDFNAAAADAAYAAGVYSGTELTGTGYTAGGATLTTTTFTGSAGVATFDAADPSWTTSTITGARGALVYVNTLTPKAGLVLIDLGNSYSTSAGTLLIQFAAGGVWNVDLVP